MGSIKFNGISSDDLGLIVQFIPTYQYPEKEYETVTIPGRSGDLLVDKGTFKNVERTYSFARVFGQNDKFVNVANSIVEWLHSADGYARLEDTYEPLYYREAVYKADGEMGNYYDDATAIEVTFECKPQRWLIEGEQPVTVPVSSSTHSGTKQITNPTTFPAKPTIIFTTIPGNTTTISIAGNTLIFASQTVAKTITIDCENMECYSGDTLYNSSLSFRTGSFPVINGKAQVTLTVQNVTNCQIIPRWWTL